MPSKHLHFIAVNTQYPYIGQYTSIVTDYLKSNLLYKLQPYTAQDRTPQVYVFSEKGAALSIVHNKFNGTKLGKSERNPSEHKKMDRAYQVLFDLGVVIRADDFIFCEFMDIVMEENLAGHSFFIFDIVSQKLLDGLLSDGVKDSDLTTDLIILNLLGADDRVAPEYTPFLGPQLSGDVDTPMYDMILKCSGFDDFIASANTCTNVFAERLVTTHLKA